ncbi:uncharacterized protein [Branchiostoma lanceolatum]|uniref:uncharacterized protein n=1 Tax=Branchiostoma lanceolatum TaxID=7740 RepID=UPI0034512BF0
MNIHNLRHYGQMVRELGPLWAHSFFFFEDVNGQVLKLILGPQAVEEQVLRAVAILQKFSEAGEECFRPGTASKKLYDSLRNVVVSPEERSNFSKIAHGCMLHETWDLQECQSRPNHGCSDGSLGFPPREIHVIPEDDEGWTNVSLPTVFPGRKSQLLHYCLHNSWQQMFWGSALLPSSNSKIL